MKIKRFSLIVAVALLCLAIADVTQVFGASPGSQSPGVSDPFASYVAPTGPLLTEAQAVSEATTVAQQSGESSPGVSIGAGTLEAAMRTVDHSYNRPEPTNSAGFTAMLASPVYLVAMTGNFTLPNARLRRGAPAPKGDVLDLILDAHTGQMIGRALPTPEAQAAQAAINVNAAASRAYIALHRVRTKHHRATR